MRLALSSQIRKIDSYAINTLGIPAEVLMGRSGAAVARAARSLCKVGDSVVILAGKGNNGGDGYAAACELISDYDILVYDVFSGGQKTKEGRHFLEKYISLGGVVKPLESMENFTSDIEKSDLIIDAIFGTGFTGDLPEIIKELASVIRSSSARKIAVDVPIGVNADDGSVTHEAINVDITVGLSYLKPGLLSYPAADYCGRVILDTLDLPGDKIEEHIQMSSNLFDLAEAEKALPPRISNSSKGTYGKALLIAGSKEYMGAGLLSIEAALRGGAGYITHVCSESERVVYALKFPEVIYNTDIDNIEKISALSKRSSSTLIGSGSGVSEHLADLVENLIKIEGSPLVIDADAINSIAKYNRVEALKSAKRKVILTPHPLEFSRLCGRSVSQVQSNRIGLAKSFAWEYGVILVLKGARTIITDGNELYINSSGSSALAKAGSGDVLAGAMASILAYHPDPLKAAALAVYLHGRAADNLSEELSEYGVTPSDLPREIAKTIKKIQV